MKMETDISPMMFPNTPFSGAKINKRQLDKQQPNKEKIKDSPLHQLNPASSIHAAKSSISGGHKLPCFDELGNSEEKLLHRAIEKQSD
ncbi:hypothetical protein PanWU01x14_178970 [Parasponia andersonii]|uniref:Uncharacterized protein n=1 Tax=Parasponia andersonii TaxID=3476 RepID=A0A2P5C6M2_PARAD|nr:hypothetical protein PanWU01x14_178970 [Parasponia andersonii]